MGDVLPAAFVPASPPRGSVTTVTRASGPLAAPSLWQRLGGFVALTKPRIVEQLLITTLPTMVVAARGWPGLGLVLATLAGGTLAAGGANAINMFVDRDIDAVMHRTARRPLVTGVVQPASALIFAICLEAVAFALLAVLVNFLAASLAVSATLFYVFVYTLWLKRTTPQNIVIGGAAGAVPILVGWAAVRGSLDWAPIILFALIFVWTPPHFWALAMRYKDDYASVHVPMLPVVATLKRTAAQIVGYSVAVWVVSLLFGYMAHLGLIYWASASVLGAAFVGFSLDLYRTRTEASAMRLFHFSLTYITVLFAAMTVDVLVRHL